MPLHKKKRQSCAISLSRYAGVHQLPFISKQLRTAIEATVTSTSVRYKRPVVMASGVIEGYKEGFGSVDGGRKSIYEANYSGSFVRRGAPS